MGAVIRVNGVETPESIAVIDTANNIITLETMFTGEQKLSADIAYAEVNLFGDFSE